MCDSTYVYLQIFMYVTVLQMLNFKHRYCFKYVWNRVNFLNFLWIYLYYYLWSERVYSSRNQTFSLSASTLGWSVLILFDPNRRKYGILIRLADGISLTLTRQRVTLRRLLQLLLNPIVELAVADTYYSLLRKKKKECNSRFFGEIKQFL